MASGLGTPNARSIVPALCGGAPIPAATTSTAKTPTTATTATTVKATATVTGLQSSGITLGRLGTRSSRLGTRVHVRLRARDGHGLAMVYSASGLPRGLRINARTGAITGRAKHAGTRVVTVRVSDGHGGFARASFRWRVRTPRHRS
jgi:hypothetical protein